MICRQRRVADILITLFLIVGLAGLIGCSGSQEQSSVPVIKQGGKELTILSSTIMVTEYEYIAVADVKNTGSEPIRYAELEMDFYDVTGKPMDCLGLWEGGEWERREYTRFVIKDLAVGEVQTLYAEFYRTSEGSFKIKVNKLE